MANKREFELAIKIAGMIDESLNNACNLTKKQLRGIAKEAADASKETTSFGTAMDNAGAGIDGAWNMATGAVKTTVAALAVATGAAAAAGGAIIGVGSEFESAFAGVKKTVDATDQQLEDLEEGLRLMAKNKPQTAVELAEIAEAAGQLGIYTENIEDFTNVMADLKVATNLGDEGASQFAKFANITGMAQDKFDRLGSAVVDLGNNMATTESDIVNMAMRLAGAGTQVKMSEADIMGFAAALSSVGIEAEMGGSAMSKMMIEMQLAVETGLDAWGPLEEALAKTGHTAEQAEIAVAKGGNALKNFAAATGQNSKQLRESVKDAQKSAGSLQDFADVANMTSEEFASAFKDNAAKAMGAFISGLNDTERLGQSAIVTLDAMDIKEVRLRDTLLRAANASGLFNESIDRANNAFNENTALTKEADQRYATFESRLDMVKNRVTDMGITLYQDFRAPLSDVLGVTMEFTDEMGALDNDYLKGLADNFQKSIPTVIRQLRDAKEAVVDFAGPFIEVGDWMIEHTDVIAGALAGIGTTIVTMKLAKEITGVTTSLNTLRLAMMSNPVLAAVGLAAMAGGAIVGIVTQIEMSNKRLAKQKLAKSFGDISLSMGELKEVADNILGEKTLEQFRIALEETGKIKTVANDIQAASRTLDRLNWKIGMGLKLGDTDITLFKASIDSTIQDSIALVEQAQYTARVNINALFGEGDATGNLVLSGLNAMYGNINAEVSRLGEELGKKYSEAMGDGIIDVDEAEAIRGLQEKLAKITEEVAASQLDAKLERIQLQYGGKELDAETFKNLQAEIQGTLSEMSAAASQSYDYTLSSLKLQLNRSQSGDIAITDAEYLTQEMYDQVKEQLDAQLLKKQLEIDVKGISFQTDSIIGAFSESIGEAVPQMGESLDTAMRETLNYIGWSGMAQNGWSVEQVRQWLNCDGLDQATRDALSELWAGMEPDFNNLVAIKRQYEAAGMEIPAEIVKGINEAAAVGILAGSTDALWVAMGETARTSPEYQAALVSMMENGVYIVDELAKGVTSNEVAMKQGIENLHNVTDMELRKAFKDFTVNPKLFINYSVSETFPTLNSPSKPKIGGLATGGIVENERLTWFAEDGPEAAIPLDGSQRSKSIWQEAGERLGILDSEGDGGTSTGVNGNNSSFSNGDTQNRNESQIIYSPTYQVYGSSVDTVKQATNDDYRRFESFMRQYEKSKARLSF